jgi:hypothetical protein
VDGERLGRLSRRILADVLSIGSAATAGPVWSPEQEGELLEAIRARLHPLLERHGHEGDDAVARRFRQAHAGLYQGQGQEAGPQPPEGAGKP